MQARASIERVADLGFDPSVLRFDRRGELFAFLVERGHRNAQLWMAMDHANRVTTLSSVPDRDRPRLIHAKNLTTLLTVLIDDVADRTRQPELLRDLVRILQRPDDRPLAFEPTHPNAVLAAAAWDEVLAVLRTAPRFSEFLDLWLFDMAELVQSQRYNLVINENPALANTAEYLAYGTHNFNVKPHLTMDLMFSPDFAKEDLGPFRKAQQHIQVAVQLVNDRYTLDRELDEEGAIASYPVIWSLEEGHLTMEHIRLGGLSKAVQTLSREALTHLQRDHLREAAAVLSRVHSFDVGPLFDALGEIEELYRRAHGAI